MKVYNLLPPVIKESAKQLRSVMARIRLVSLKKRPNFFCIGRNKTGTTSIEQALWDLAYIVGNQAAAELLIHAYARRHFQKIVKYCGTAEAFQDIPFSLPFTYQVLDYAFSGSKFILSVRDSEEEWFGS